jgi:hypothetical protein
VAGIDEAVAVRAALDEHHRREVVEVPARGDLDQIGLVPAHQWLHPLRGRLVVVDRRPGITDPHVVRLEVAVHQRVVVLDAALDEELIGDLAELPPRGHVSRRPLAGPGRHEIDAVIQDFGFLLACHGDRVLVAVAV